MCFLSGRGRPWTLRSFSRRRRRGLSSARSSCWTPSQPPPNRQSHPPATALDMPGLVSNPCWPPAFRRAPAVKRTHQSSHIESRRQVSSRPCPNFLRQNSMDDRYRSWPSAVSSTTTIRGNRASPKGEKEQPRRTKSCPDGPRRQSRQWRMCCPCSVPPPS